jgi:hypothetical protein
MKNQNILTAMLASFSSQFNFGALSPEKRHARSLKQAKTRPRTYKNKHGLPSGFAGAKLMRKAMRGELTLRGRC